MEVESPLCDIAMFGFHANARSQEGGDKWVKRAVVCYSYMTYVHSKKRAHASHIMFLSVGRGSGEWLIWMTWVWCCIAGKRSQSSVQRFQRLQRMVSTCSSCSTPCLTYVGSESHNIQAVGPSCHPRLMSENGPRMSMFPTPGITARKSRLGAVMCGLGLESCDPTSDARILGIHSPSPM